MSRERVGFMLAWTKSAIERCSRLAAKGKLRIDQDTFVWPKRKKKKIWSEENRAGEYHMIIPRQINF